MDIARGIDKMHSRRLVHLDLKSPNVLLSASGTAKIAVRTCPALARSQTPQCYSLVLIVRQYLELSAAAVILIRGAFGLWHCNSHCQLPCGL